MCDSGVVAAFMNYKKTIFEVEFLTLASLYSPQGFQSMKCKASFRSCENTTFTVTNSGLGNPPSGKLAAWKC